MLGWTVGLLLAFGAEAGPITDEERLVQDSPPARSADEPDDRRPPGPPRGPRPRPGEGRPMGPPGWEGVIDRVAQHRPDVADRLQALVDESPRRVDELFAALIVERLADRILEEQPAPPDRQRPPPWRDDSLQGGPPGDIAPGAGPRPRPPPGPRRGPGPEGRRPGPPPGGPGGRPPPGDRLPPELKERLDRADDADIELAEQCERSAAAARALADRRSDDSERIAAEQALAETVRQHFEARTTRRSLEVERIEHELKRLTAVIDRIREDLKRREADRDEIVTRRVRELLRPGRER